MRQRMLLFQKLRPPMPQQMLLSQRPKLQMPPRILHPTVSLPRLKLQTLLNQQILQETLLKSKKKPSKFRKKLLFRRTTLSMLTNKQLNLKLPSFQRLNNKMLQRMLLTTQQKLQQLLKPRVQMPKTPPSSTPQEALQLPRRRQLLIISTTK